MATDPVADNILQLVDATDDCKCPSAPTASAEEGEAEIESADVPEAEEAAEDEAAPGDEPDAEGAALAELSAKETHPLSMALHAASAIHQEDTFAKGGKNVVSIFAQYPDEEGKHALKGALALTTFEEAHDLPDKNLLVVHYSNGNGRSKAAKILRKAAENLERLDGQLPFTIQLPKCDRPVESKMKCQADLRARAKLMTKDLCSPRAVFSRQVAEMMLPICEILFVEEKKFSTEALGLLHLVTEEYLCEVYREAAIFAMHAKRATIFDKDIRLALQSAADRAHTHNAMSMAQEKVANPAGKSLKFKRPFVADCFSSSSSSSTSRPSASSALSKPSSASLPDVAKPAKGHVSKPVDTFHNKKRKM